jgi:hypothetical protein
LVVYLHRNPCVRYWERDGCYSFKVLYEKVTDGEMLVQQLASTHRGIHVQDLADTYAGVGEDIEAFVRDGRVVRMRSSKAKEKEQVLFARGPRFCVKLSGHVSAEPGDWAVQTSCDVTNEVRRGDLVEIEGEIFRVSTTAKGDDAKKTRCPDTVSSTRGFTQSLKESDFVHAFTRDQLPLDRPWSGGAGGAGGAGLVRGVVYKDGCTNDIRALWKAEGESMAVVTMSYEGVVKELEDANQSTGRSRRVAANKRPRGGGKKGAKGAGKRQRRQRVRTHDTNKHLKGTKYEAGMKHIVAGQGQVEKSMLGGSSMFKS